MKNIILIITLLFCNLLNAQKTPTIYINGSPILLQGDVSLPYWVNASSTIALGPNAVSASILEFNVANNELAFNQAIHLTTTGTVPTGTVWKIEAIGIGSNSNHPNTSGFSTDVSPTIFQSPKTFTTTSTWTVPNNVTNICIEAWGKGGKGGDGIAGSGGNPLSGGGGGAYAYQCVNVTPGDFLNITINSDSTFVETYISARAGSDGANGSTTGSATAGLGGVNINTSYYSISGDNAISSKGGDAGNGGNGGISAGYQSPATSGEFPGGGGGLGRNNTVSNYRYGAVGGGGQVIIYF